MSNKSHAGMDDCASYRISARHKCLKEAVAACSLQVSVVQEYFPSLAQSRTAKTVAAATQFFRFFQEDGQWAWQRVQEPELVLETSSSTFTSYSRCAADARRHGWKGRPLRLFALPARKNRISRSKPND